MQFTIKLIILVKQCFDMPKKLNSTESVELVLPKYDEEAVAKGWDDVLEKFPISIQKIKDWFKEYDVDTIEIYISGVIEMGGIMQISS